MSAASSRRLQDVLQVHHAPSQAICVVQGTASREQQAAHLMLHSLMRVLGQLCLPSISPHLLTQRRTLTCADSASMHV